MFQLEEKWRDLIKLDMNIISNFQQVSKQTELQTAALEARLTAVSDSLNSKLNSLCENLNMEM